MCGLRTRPRTDVDPLRVELPSAGGISSRRPRGDNLLISTLLLRCITYIVQTRVSPKNNVLDGAHIGATCQIRLNDPCAAAMRLYVKLLWPLVKPRSQHINRTELTRTSRPSYVERLYIVRCDVTASMAATRSPFCGYIMAHCVELRGKSLSCYLNKVLSVDLCPYDH